MRKAIPLLVAIVSVAVLVGCGGEQQGSANGTGTPEQVEDAGQLGMVRAHETVSLRLYEEGEAAQASKHAGHPTEEIFFSLARTLRSKDAALTADLRKALKRPNDLILDGAPPEEVKAAYDSAWGLLDRAATSLVPDDVRDTTAFRAQVIANLLEKVEEEYGEAVVDGRLEKPIEFQDAWGALEEAERRFAADRASFGKEADKIEEQLGTLDEAMPSLTPPVPRVSAEKVETAVDAAVAELNEVAGVQAAPKDPVAELKEVGGLLTEARNAYAKGEREQAQELVSEAYLEHFEKVEPALAERDKELMESLEVLIATELRNEIKAGAPKTKVNALVRQALRELDDAEKVLKEGS